MSQPRKIEHIAADGEKLLAEVKTYGTYQMFNHRRRPRRIYSRSAGRTFLNPVLYCGLRAVDSLPPRLLSNFPGYPMALMRSQMMMECRTNCSAPTCATALLQTITTWPQTIHRYHRQQRPAHMRYSSLQQNFGKILRSERRKKSTTG